MKRLSMIITGVLLLSCLGGCSSLPREVPQTNETLTISYYGTDFGAIRDTLNDSVKIYKEAYPEVEVTVLRFPYSATNDGGKEYFTKLAAEVMSGKGPDVFWINPAFMDVYKMMGAGAFADLTEFMEKDTSISWAEYQQTVIDGGKFKGRQYIMPLCYSIPILLTEKSVLEKSGFPSAQCGDYFALWEELDRYTTRHLESDSTLPQLVRVIGRLESFPSFLGADWVDFENKKADLSGAEWKKAFELYKSLLRAKTEQEDTEMPVGYSITKALEEGAALFETNYGYGSYVDALSNARAIATFGEPDFLPLYDMSGGLQARIEDSVGVAQTSPNQQNAYNFIKILLSPYMQDEKNGFGPSNIPISDAAFRESLDIYEKEMDTEGKIWMITDPSGYIPDFSAVPTSFTQKYWEATRKVSHAYFRNETINILERDMEPYLKGESSYEDAIKEATQNLRIYITE